MLEKEPLIIHLPLCQSFSAAGTRKGLENVLFLILNSKIIGRQKGF